MAEFGKMELTEKGSLLLNKVITREIRLEIVRIAVGSGKFGGNIWELTNLISGVLDANIVKSGEAEGQWEVEVIFTNEEITEDFEFREIGVFAIDPDDGEILYSYSNSGENCDYINSYNGSNLEEERINVKIYTAGTSNVYAEIVKSEIASQIEYDDSVSKINSNNVQTAIEKVVEKIKDVETEAKNKDGGNADTVDGKHASDLQNYNNLTNRPNSMSNPYPLTVKLSGTEEEETYYGNKSTLIEVTQFKDFNSINELRESKFQGYFKIKGYNILTGISFRAENTDDDAPSDEKRYENYVRIVTKISNEYFNVNRELSIFTDILCLNTNTWTHNENDISLQGHKHLMSEITDLPENFPANGGNADTLGGKTLSEIQNYNNLENKPSSLPADGGNADTLGNLSKTDFVLSQRTAGDYDTILEWANAQSQSAAAWFEGKDDEPPNTVQGREVHYLLLKGPAARATVVAFQYGLSGQGIYKRQTENNNWYNNWVKINDGGNSDTLDNKHASDFYQCDRTSFKLGETILEWANAQSTNASKGIVQKNYPEDIPVENNEGIAEVIVFEGNRKVVRFISYPARTTYIRTIFNSKWITAWKKTEDGGNASTLGGKTLSEVQNASSVNKKTKTFTVQTGSWFRLARNNKDSCGGVFVLTVGSGSASSTTVFSAAQQYSSVTYNELKLKCLSHSSFNSCVTKLRAVNQSGSSYEQYIDFYVAGGTNGSTGDVEVQFFGKGWSVYDSIVSANIASGYTTTEISLQ